MNLLLDTCTFLWMAGAVEQLSAPASLALEDTRNHLILHQGSLWEIQIKYQTGKLLLADAPQVLVEAGLRKHSVHFHSLRNEDIWHLQKLPSHHRDPFDRILLLKRNPQRVQLNHFLNSFARSGVKRVRL